MSASSDFVKKLIGDQKQKVKTIAAYTSKNEEWRFSVARVMLTGILKNQYYKTAEASAKEALPLIIKAAKTDPVFLLKAAAFARDANMKGMVLLGVAALSANAKDAFLTTNRPAIVSLLSTFNPDQLMQFVDLMKSKVLGKGFGARPQKWVQSVMENWDAKRVEDYTLKHPKDFYALLRLVHPSFTDNRGKLVDYLLTSPGKGKAYGKKQKAIEKMKKLSNEMASEKEIAKLMLDNAIPWDSVKGFHAIKGDVGLAMMTQMGLSGLLKNIRSLEQNGVLSDKNSIKALELKLNEVKNGRSIPIDFAKAYIYSTDPSVKKLLVKAIVDSLSNSMPHIEGRKIGVSVDVSGSMTGEPLKTAGLLSVPFLKARELWFTVFDDKLHEEPVNRLHNSLCPKLTGQSPEKQVDALLNMQTDGATDVAISVRKATQSKRFLDLHVLITDEQQNSGTPLITAWKSYKKNVNPRAELWVVNATNTEWHAADFNDPSITVYQTMTPAIFKNLQFLGQDLVSAINSFDINKNSKQFSDIENSEQ